MSTGTTDAATLRETSARTRRAPGGRAMLACCTVVAFLAGCSASRRGRDDGGSGGAGGGQDDGPGGQGGSGADVATDRGPRKGCQMGGGTVGFLPTEFRDPEVQCHWGGGDGTNVMSTTMVVDLDGDGRPEVVFPAYDAKVHAISGTDCSDVWATTVDATIQPYDLAVGDLDGDGLPEVAVGIDGGLVVLDGKTGAIIDTAKPAGFARGVWEPVSIANLDGVGNPEVFLGNTAFRLEAGKVTAVWVTPGLNGFLNYSAAIADLDGDGIMEVVQDGKVADGATGVIKKTLPGGGFAAIADFDPGSPGAEVILVDPTAPLGSAVVVVAGLMAPAPGKVLFGPYGTGDMSPSGGGPPAVADFDNDGEPEIGVAGAHRYTVYDRECAVTPLPTKCSAPGIRWTSHSQDQSSRVTTSTVFDFNCDGKAEVVYRDECWLRVYDGESGTVRFAMPMTSNTALEGAVVVDSDDTGHAKIVIGANDISGPRCPKAGALEEYTMTPFTDVSRGVFILRDPMNRWSATRKVWNENAYHVSNVNADGTIPAKEPASWSGENSYRANSASE